MIKTVQMDKHIYSLEFVDENGKYHYVYFNDDNKSELKSKTKEYKKNGTLTFISIKGTSAISDTYNPQYVRVSKVLEMYIKEEDNERETVPDAGQSSTIQDSEV